MKTKSRYWKYVSGSIAFLMSISLIACGGGGGGSDNGTVVTSSSSSVLAFSINGATGIVDQTTKTIAVTLPSGTAVSALIATFSTTGSTVKVGSTPQVSGVTSNNFTSPVAYVVTAADGSISTYTATVSVASTTSKAISSYAIGGVAGTINEATKTIGVLMPAGTAVTSLIANYSTTGSTVQVGSTIQVSGSTTNNFTNPVTYVVTAADASTSSYEVIVSVSAASSSSLTSFSLGGTVGTVNESTKTIGVVVPSGTSVSALIATFSSTGSTVKVGSTSQVSGITSNNFNSPVAYVVTAADGSSTTYTTTVTVAATSSKAFSSFVLGGVTGTINEATKTIGVVMPSGTSVSSLIATFSSTGSTVKVGSTTQVSGITSNNFTSPVAYVVTAADGSSASYTTTVTVAATSSKAISSFALSGVNGTINESTKTIGLVMPTGTAVSSLVATFATTGSSVKIGSIVQVSGATSNNFTSPVAYIVTAADASTSTYTVTVTVAAASSKAITSYSLDGTTGIINETAKTIQLAMPAGTVASSLVATFSTTGSSVKIGGTVQVSGATINDFTSPVAYIVTAADGSTSTYSVTATVAATSSKAITSFVLSGVTGTINESAKTIGVLMPSGTAVSSLIATFVTTGSTVQVASTTQVSGTTANNFTSPVAYVVTAADATTNTYTVTVTVAPTSSKAITSYSLAGTAGTINETSKSIAVVMPSGTAVSSLIATFVTTGSSVNVGSTAQTSGATSNNFSSPVAYVVTAADTSTNTYTVTVTVAAAGPAPVALGTAGNYVLFSNAGMSSSPDSAITGDVGVGPAVTSTAITTGFTKVMDASGTYSTAVQVTGKIYAFDYASPTPTYIVSSSNDMGIAYDDARGRLNPDFTNVGGANLGGQILLPGLYKWTGSINLALSTTVTLNGGPNDVWILQIAGGLTTGANSRVALTGGALPENVFWQFDTALTTGADSTFNGIALAGSAVNLGARTAINGRLLAKTAITMDANSITKPAN